MSTTAQKVFDRAVQRGDLNNPDLLPSAQIMDYITQFERAVYLRAAKVNPEFFGTSGVTATRAATTTPWDVSVTPSNVAAITSAEAAAVTGAVTGVSVGTVINLISRRWPTLAVSPRAYILGRKLFQYGSELGTDGSNLVTSLTIYYSPLPTSIVSLSQSLSLSDEFTDLVVLPLARVLSLRDRRMDEVQFIDAEYAYQLQLFDEAIGIFAHGASRPLVSVPAGSFTPTSAAPSRGG